MGAKVFVLGRPGSGKSTAAHFIIDKAREINLPTYHLYDFPILYRMFHEDTEGRFQPRYDGNFDIIDLTVYNEALQTLEKLALEIPSSQLVIIEFARNDYREALKQFSPDFLNDSFFLYFDANTETCLERAHKRMDPSNPYSHPIRSDEKYREYYGRDIREYMSSQFTEEFQLGERYKFISNEGSPESLEDQLDKFVKGELFLYLGEKENGLLHFKNSLKET